MGAFYDEVPDESHEQWIRQQKIFFVASAPASLDGHVNVSPKGHATFTLASRRSCFYQDLTGSGNEVVSHLRENGRITIMFCAFEGAPRILRLFGIGKVFERGTKEYNEILPPGDERILPGSRAIIWVDVHKVGTSCGYSVPYFDFVKERKTLLDSMSKREAYDVEHPSVPTTDEKKSLKTYWKVKNSRSMDGLPGLDLGLRGAPKAHLQPRHRSANRTTDLLMGLFVGVVLTLLSSSWASSPLANWDKLRSAFEFGYA